MSGPYRLAGPVETDPPSNAGTPGARCSDVDAGACPWRCAPREAAPASRLPQGFARALSVAATTLLLVASASLSAITWSVLEHQFRGGRAAVSTLQAPDAALATLGPETHAVDELWRRAEQLAAAGSGVVLLRTEIPGASGSLPIDGVGTSRLRPEQGAGVRVFGLAPRSTPVLAGLENGDLITAVNGYPMRAPEAALQAYPEVQRAHAAVLELVRDHRRIVLRVGWKA